jgi:hypothetical protein
LCALGILQEENAEGSKGKSLLSESIWGSIILKMAYQRDAKLQNLARKAGLADDTANLAIFSITGGVLAQGILSETTLNPPKPPLSDSYLPGSIGLGTTGLLTLGIGAQSMLHWKIRREVKARQQQLAKEVESILDHMEYSETECPEAQKQLATLIGDRAARECEKLWRSSHLVASIPGTELDPENSTSGTTIGTDHTLSIPATTISARLETESETP